MLVAPSRARLRTRHRVYLLSSAAIFGIFGPANSQEQNKAQLPPVTVQQSKSALPTKKKTAKTTSVKTAPVEPSPLKSQPEPQSTSVAGGGTALSPGNALSKLSTPNSVGSALKLTPKETPATVNVITEKEIEERGARSLIETYNLVPGVFSGNNPGEPGVASLRGFSRAAVGYSVDGARALDPLLVSRDYDTFNFERVEVLKGPASVVNGTGALAGSINLVTKQAVLNKTFVEGTVSYGSFETERVGAGFNAALSPSAALRSTFVYSQSDGYIDDTDWRKLGSTTNLTLAPTSDLKFTAAFNYFHDDFNTPYWGTPLVSPSIARDPTSIVKSANGLVIDKALRYQNYNTEDGRMESDAAWARGTVDYKLAPAWTLSNEFNSYIADREWADGEVFGYAGGLITRSGAATLITHDHEFWADRASLAFDGQIGGFRNRFVAGAEYIDTDLSSQRRFGNLTSVDPFNPVRGVLPADTSANYSTRQNFDSHLITSAAFAEEAFNITPQWLVVGGARFEKMELEREIFNLNTNVTTNFDRDFESTTWRLGTTYEVVPGTTLFAQYTEAAVPVATLLLSNTVNGRFDLSTGQSYEAGIKASLFNDTVVTTFAAYQIDQDNIITRDSTNPSLQVQGGSQRSRGLEADASIAVTKQLNVTLGGTIIDAEFTSLRSSGGVDLTGNRPINVSPYALSAVTTYRFDTLPFSLGASLQHVGPFYTNTTNTIEAQERTIVDAWIGYDIGQGTLRLRGRNLTDAFYADWSGYGDNQLYLGAPRSFDVSYSVKW